MTFEYMHISTSMDSIDVEDIGNVYIKASNDNADVWFMSIKTFLGWCEVKQFGPLKLDENGFDYFFNFFFQKFEYSEKKLFKLINEFINNPKKSITIAEVITAEEFNGKLEEVANGIR